MRQAVVIALAAIVLLGCHGESSQPEATGKGAVRAINAIPTSPEIGFQIEERSIDGVAYKNNTVPVFWDDLAYTFNFDAILADGEITRIASEPLDVVADVEYTMVVRGNLTSPTVNVWQIPGRDFSGSESVFELRVGHASATMGNVDVYFAPEGVDPVAGQQFATLAPGAVSSPRDLPQDSYVVTVTAPGDPATVLLRTTPSNVVPAQSVLITLFDGDGNDTSPYVARIFNQTGASSGLTDERFPPTVRYVHGTMDLATSDIYDDAAVTNRIVTGLEFGGVTGDIDSALGESTITFTAVDNPGAILYDTTLTTLAGNRLNFYMTVDDNGLIGTQLRVDRRSIETFAKLTFFHSAFNHSAVDLYVVEPGTSITDTLPSQINLTYGFQAPLLRLTAGSWELYVTTSGEKTILEGPVAFDTVLGGIYEGILLDRIDPALAEFRFFPAP
jgi:hypothetical protein